MPWIQPSSICVFLCFPGRSSTTSGLRADQRIVLTGKKSRAVYPETLRRVSYVDMETQKRFVFLTNIFSVPARTVTEIYRQRWQIELFFRWIKQHLRIKTFYGTSSNAVKTQIWIAIIMYLLVAIVKKRLHLQGNLHTILQILEVNIFEKKSIIQIVNLSPCRKSSRPFPDQVEDRRQDMAKGIGSEKVAEGLHGDDSAWNGILFRDSLPKEDMKRFPRAGGFRTPSLPVQS